MNQQDLRILYMQIREDQMTREEELNEFIRYSGLTRDQFTVLNTFDTPSFPPTVIEGYDALFVGGSSDASVREPETYPFVEPSKKLIRYCLEQSIPVFASCFGFQVAVEALGKKVILDKERMEMGTYPISLTDAAKIDPLFHDTPNNFIAVSGHKERAAELPDGVTLLAYTDLCPYHAIRVDGKPFYAFQFHPEIDKDDFCGRITRYKERYLDSDGALQKVLDTAQPTPEANKLVRKFVERILLA
ncbi:MAG: type 1 glutamine amidotransferase [Patescibacteria group bacterium]